MMQRAAEISKDGVYRYTLERTWNPEGSRVMFIMLNPSTADGSVDDPTVRKCISFARRWEFGSLVICNLYAYRTYSPDKLFAASEAGVDIEGTDNDMHLTEQIGRAYQVVLAWGARANPGRAADVVNTVRQHGHHPVALAITSNGQPGHPLYLPYDSKRIPYPAED